MQSLAVNTLIYITAGSKSQTTDLEQQDKDHDLKVFFLCGFSLFGAAIFIKAIICPLIHTTNK